MTYEQSLKELVDVGLAGESRKEARRPQGNR